MANRSFVLTAALLLAFTPVAYAGYAMAKPPPGWATGPTGTPLFKPVGPMPTTAANGTMNAANGMSYGPGGMRGTTTVPAGTDIPVSYAFKYAVTAGAAAASMLATNPAILLMAMAAPHILDWLNPPGQNDYRMGGPTGIEKKSEKTDEFCTPIQPADCYGGPPQLDANQCYASAGISCPAPLVAYRIGNKTQGPVTTKWDPVYPGDFPTEFGDKPITPGLPWFLPDPLPVDVPVINPSPAPVEQPWPSPAPQPQPLRVPQSDPVAIPNTNPQEYRQPWIEITPSPAPSAPWRVNVQPKETTTTDPTVQTGPVTVPVPTPDAPGTPSTTPQNPDLCTLHPDAIACLKKGDPGTLEPVPLFNQDKDVSQIQKTGSYGPASGTCPTGQTLHIGSTPIELGYGSLCEFATMINPLVIGFAWLSAAFTFFGFARKD